MKAPRLINFTFVFSVVFGLGFVGCASRDSTRVSATYDHAVDQAFAELNSRDNRKPASAQVQSQLLNLRFGDLRKSFDVLVFPKISNITAKTGRRPEVNFGKPVRFTVTAQRLLSCDQLLKDPGKQWQTQNFQTGQPASQCAILKIQQTDPKIRPADLRSGDVVETRLYVDDAYRIYGADFETATSKRSVETRRLRIDPETQSGSGLFLLPLDLPNLSLQESAGLASANVSKDPYVIGKMQKAGISMCPQGQSFRYQDQLGIRQSVVWCAGDPWPTSVENAHSLSVLVKGGKR